MQHDIISKHNESLKINKMLSLSFNRKRLPKIELFWCEDQLQIFSEINLLSGDTEYSRDVNI